jgi:hypothetical protein
MTDKELLELAAKAAGRDTNSYYRWYESPSPGFYRLIDDEPTAYKWNPLTDDGDALRLAVNLGLNVICDSIGSVTVRKERPKAFVQLGAGDPYAATRRAIVRAAAEIGKGME